MIVADTHTWLWWVSREGELSTAAAQALHEAETIGIPAISCWEVAMLMRRQRIQLRRDLLPWLREATTTRKMKLLPLTPEIGATAGTLDETWVRNPADRLIVATAIEHRVPLVTKDGRIRRSGLVETIW